MCYSEGFAPDDLTRPGQRPGEYGKSFLKLSDTVETCPKVMFWIRLDTFGYV